MTATRSHAIDNGRGLLALFMVMGHTVMDPAHVAIQQLLYLFHMPAFVLLSSLLVKPISWHYVLSRAQRLLLPLLFILTLGRALLSSLGFGISELLVGVPYTFLFGFYEQLCCGLAAMALVLTKWRPSWLPEQLRWAIIIGLLGLGAAISLRIDNYAYTFSEIAFWGNISHATDAYWLNATVFWFLPMLFVLGLLLALLSRVAVAFKWGMAGMLLVASWLALDWVKPWHPFIPWGLDIALLMLPWAILTRATFKYLNQQQGHHRSSWAMACGTAFLALLLLAWYCLPLHPIRLFNLQVCLSDLIWPSTWWQQLMLGLLSLSFIGLIATWQRPSIFSWAGQYTMTILLLHIHFIFLTDVIGHDYGLPPHAMYVLAIALGFFAPVLIAHYLRKVEPRLANLGLA